MNLVQVAFHQVIYSPLKCVMQKGIVAQNICLKYSDKFIYWNLHFHSNLCYNFGVIMSQKKKNGDTAIAYLN